MEDSGTSNTSIICEKILANAEYGDFSNNVNYPSIFHISNNYEDDVMVEKQTVQQGAMQQELRKNWPGPKPKSSPYRGVTFSRKRSTSSISYLNTSKLIIYFSCNLPYCPCFINH